MTTTTQTEDQQGAASPGMTRAQYVRWANRHEKVTGALYDALSYLRQMSLVTDGLADVDAKVGDAHHYAKDAVGCIEGAISLLGNALASMPDDVKTKGSRP